MKSVLACVSLAILAQVSLAPDVLAAQSREGRLSIAPSAPQTDRTSSYRGEQGQSLPGGSASADTDTAAKEHLGPKANKRGTQEADRLPNATLGNKAALFTIYDASSILRRDRDNDGHHSEFQIRFDADVFSGDALVYARLYIRRVGSTGNWRHYHTTDSFWIYGQSGTDDYYVTTTLDEGFGTGDYHVLIDLYEVGYSGIVATLDAYDDAALADLPLEEAGLDVPYGLPGYSIQSVSTTLLIDDDRDGFFSRFRVSFDPDTDFGTDYVYAIVWVRAEGGEWIREHESDDFLVYGSGSDDRYTITADWLTGYPTSDYDVQIDLHDADTGALVASAGSELAALAQIPLEDASRDQLPNTPPPPPSGSVVVTTSHEGGGGETLPWIATLAVLAIARLAWQRRRRQLLTLVNQRRNR
jgi:hypothetical protein